MGLAGSPGYTVGRTGRTKPPGACDISNNWIKKAQR